MRRAWIFAWAWTVGAVLAADAQGPYNAVKVANLPVCTLAKQGRVQGVNDANPDCQTGSGVAGSSYVLCICDPANGWQAIGSGGGGGAPSGAAGGDLAGTYPNPTVAPNAVALGTDTTGNYATSSGEAGPASSVAANSVALGTDTTGGYAASATEGGSASSVASNSVALGTDTTGGYAGSSTEAGAATSALAVTGFPASKCARFDGSGVLAAASGDCSAGDTVGIGGSSGSTDKALILANGTGGSTVQASANITQDASNNLILGDSSGARELWFSSVATAPVCKRNGTALHCIGNTGDMIEFQVGRISAQDPGNPSSFSGGGLVSNGKRWCYSDGVDYSRCIERVDSTITITDGSGSGVSASRDLRVRGVRRVPRSAPPYTCDAAAEGGDYYDSEDHAPCVCNGTAWVPYFGSGSCS